MSQDSFYLLIIGTVMALSLVIATDDTTTSAPSTLAPCGSYGFRCLDSKTYQVCAIGDEEGFEVQDEHDCREGLICDEENPAFCTSIDPSFTTIKMPCVPQGRVARDLEDYAVYGEFSKEENSNEYGDGRQRRDGNRCGCIETTTLTTTTTVTESTTSWYEQATVPEFDCESYGFFPDYANQTLFWFCDVPKNGEGYYIRHMICGEDRVFDPIHKACVLAGTMHTGHLKNLDRKRKKRIESSTQLSRPRKFSCCGKAPGRYADEYNCRLYHYCLTADFAPVQELTLLCPDKTAYDPATNKCSCYANYRCTNGRRSDYENVDIYDDSLQDYPKELAEVEASEERGYGERSINCQTPMRFRDVNYCDGYFLCFGDEVVEMECPEFYRFDDNLLECLPEKIARCQ